MKKIKNTKDLKKNSKNINSDKSKKNSKSSNSDKSKKNSKSSNSDKIKWKEENKGPRNIYEDFNYKIEPIKIIYKYKNFNRKNQYLIYIFLGVLGKKYEKILSKIENLNLYESLLEISKEEEIKLIEGFGELWMLKFFNIYHISAFVNKLEQKPELKNKLLKKYELIWLNNFIEKFKKEVVFRKVNYSYGDLVKFQYKIKMGKKIEKVFLEKEDIEDLNFKSDNNKQKNLLNEFVFEESEGSINEKNNKWKNILKGGYTEDNEQNFEEEINFEEELNYDEELNDIDSNDIFPVEIYTDNEEDEIVQTGPSITEINFEDIEKLYQTDEIDKNLKTTNTMISNVLENNKIVEKKENYMIKFDDYQDTYIDNENIANVYKKKFVYTQYIFKDDSIKNIKNKMCAVIKGNIRISTNAFIIPSRMYLWSEYLYNNKIEKIMIGQKWLKKNELFNIDIEPLDISQYENLSENIKNLRDSFKRYAGKIRREDEDTNILYDYNDYILNDEIYMCDIYNELGEHYKCNTEQLKNITETFFKIYFPRIKTDDILGIIDFLNKEDIKTEETKIKNTFDSIYNDLLLEKEITDLVESTKLYKKKEYTKLFESGNFITQSVIHVNLEIYDEQLEKENKENINKINKMKGEFGAIVLPKLDLFRIFNDFTPDLRYPFIQYQVPDGQINFKYFEEYMGEFSKSKDNIDMITKWFENSPYGISFKIRITNDKDNNLNDKFMAININEIGKIEYKTQWKEEDAANIYDIINTYDYVKELVEKINNTLLNHPRKITIRKPENHEFRFAFINCIQKFKLPDNKIINHNDLSDFCIYFYPYISLQIEPKKRLSKVITNDNKSKYGSYLRYKRVSKFDNVAKIEQRILSYIRNFDYEEDILSEEISKQFNITTERAKEEIQKVKAKFSNIGKTKKNILKKSDDVPKFKPPGIGIDIQGKIPEKYKIRISGAREQNQLERIIIFMNILIYLYSETYIIKNPEYQEIKEKLKKITNIAKRRGKVDEIVNYQKEVKTLKQMTQIDKKRLGYTPDEGQNQWTRSCQNSGNDKKRRPLQTLIGNLSQLLSRGYVLNKKTGEYEKKVIIKSKGKKDMEMVLKALKVNDVDEITGQSNEIFYSCDPETNGQHMYIGFLTRSNNPFGECMPCCFIKNRLLSKKKETIEFYKRCLGEKINDGEKTANSFSGDILYILQDTNKIQEGRIGYLSKYLDFIFNINFKKIKEIKNHYLLKTSSFFFKYGINQDNYSFINTLSTILNTPIQNIKKNIVDFLKKDTDEIYYFSLNDGDIRAEYRINDFIRFILDSEFIDYYYLKDLMKISGLFTKRGINTVIFNKSSTIIKKGVEKDKIKEDFYLIIDKTMVIDYEYCLSLFENKDLLILIKDGKYYYPIIEIIKNDENIKNIEIKKLFNFNDKADIFVVELVKNFFIKTIQDVQIDFPKTNMSSKETYNLLLNISKNNLNFKPIYQVVDSRYKCKFLITKDNTIIPVVPSGIIDDLSTICLNTIEYSNRQDCFSKLNFQNINQTQKNLEEIYKLSNKKLNIKPIGLFYDFISDDNFANIIGIMTSNNDLVPVATQLIPIKELEKNKVIYQNRPLYHELDMKLSNYNKNYFEIIDNRIKNVNQIKYLDEAYQLFKFELSNILSDSNFESYKNKLKKFIDSKNTNEIQQLLLMLCVSKIGDKTINKNLIGNELLHLIKDLPNLDYYKINNQRKICSKLNENECISNPHCEYVVNTKVSKAKATPKCMFVLTEKYLLEFIKNLSIELSEQEVKAYEILKEKKYFVSDIVDYNNFTEKVGQKIIKSSNTNLQKILTDLFGKEHVPKIGRRHLSKKYEIDLQTLQLENPLKDIKDAFSQTIIPFNYSILRSYVNGYYWIKHKLYTNDTRNLGYYSDIQNELVNIFRSMIIDWLNIPDNIKLLSNISDFTKKIISNPILYIDTSHKNSINNKLIINKYIIKLMEKNIEENIGLLELLILNNIHDIPIIIIINGLPKYFVENNNIKIIKSDNSSKYLNQSYICIGIELNNDSNYPSVIESIYYK